MSTINYTNIFYSFCSLLAKARSGLTVPRRTNEKQEEQVKIYHAQKKSLGKKTKAPIQSYERKELE